MPATVDEIKILIEKEFTGSFNKIEIKNYRITGTIVWNGFKNKTPETRNKIVIEKIRNKIGFRGTNLGFLLPLPLAFEKEI